MEVDDPAALSLAALASAAVCGRRAAAARPHRDRSRGISGFTRGIGDNSRDPRRECVLHRRAGGDQGCDTESQRTAKANQIRGLVAEYGLVAPQQLASLRAAIPSWLEDAENGLSARFRRLLNDLWDELKYLDQRITALDQEITTLAQQDPVAQRLQQLRGVGPLIATALVAAVGNAEQFSNGRQMAASLGLTPGQHSSGGKERLLGITKRGDVYLRTLLIHGARSVIYAARHKDDRLSQWVTGLAKRRHPNVAATALANKTARIAWAMLRRGTDYQPDMMMPA